MCPAPRCSRCPGRSPAPGLLCPRGGRRGPRGPRILQTRALAAPRGQGLRTWGFNTLSPGSRASSAVRGREGSGPRGQPEPVFYPTPPQGALTVSQGRGRGAFRALWAGCSRTGGWHRLHVGAPSTQSPRHREPSAPAQRGPDTAPVLLTLGRSVGNRAGVRHRARDGAWRPRHSGVRPSLPISGQGQPAPGLARRTADPRAGMGGAPQPPPHCQATGDSAQRG